MTVQQRVIIFINLQHEGDTWDFKREWHHDSVSLLHDIICMANLITDEVGLIIIGVDDENGYSICDVSSDPNRRDTMKLVTFLRDKRFAGGVRPMAHVEALNLGDKTVDVIVVEKSAHVPFYLTEDFKEKTNQNSTGKVVRANYIYTRVGDTNTPIDKSADPDKVEALWRKHFGIDLKPADKFMRFLADCESWKSLDGCRSWFYEPSPELTIVLDLDVSATGFEYFCLAAVNNKPFWYDATFLYYQTAIDHTRCVTLEEGSVFLAAPDFEMYRGEKFYYYVADSKKLLLNEFFCREYTDSSYRYVYGSLYEIVPIFESEQEKQDFFNWLKEQNLPKEPRHKYVECTPEYLNPGFKQSKILIEMIERFRIV